MIDFEKMKECIFKPKINIKYIFKIEKIYNSILYRHKKQIKQKIDAYNYMSIISYKKKN